MIAPGQQSPGLVQGHMNTIVLLKYELSRRLVLTVHIPNLATPAGGSSRRPLWRVTARLRCCSRWGHSRRLRWGEWIVRRAGHLAEELTAGAVLYIFDSGDSGEVRKSQGKVRKTAIFRKRWERLFINLRVTSSFEC